MPNLYDQFRQLIPNPPLQAGTVRSVNPGGLTIELPGGSLVRARGEASVGQIVFVRDNAVEGIAPSLQLVPIEI